MCPYIETRAREDTKQLGAGLTLCHTNNPLGQCKLNAGTCRQIRGLGAV
jgi:hypothetical protein